MQKNSTAMVDFLSASDVVLAKSIEKFEKMPNFSKKNFASRRGVY